MLPLSAEIYGFLVGSFILIVTGVADDRRPLNPKFRLLAQFIAIMTMIFLGSLHIETLGNLFSYGNISLGVYEIPFTLITAIGLINAINMLDGMDGLAGSLAVIQALLLLALTITHHAILDTTILALFIASILGFLSFNHPLLHRHAKIFMGDGGSLFLGFVFTWFVIKLSQGSQPIAPPITMIWIMIVPLYDFVRIFFLRIKSKQSPLNPDRQHMHHLLLDTGYSKMQTLTILCSISFIGGLVGVISAWVNLATSIQFYSYIFLFITYCQLAKKIKKPSGELLEQPTLSDTPNISDRVSFEQ